MDSVLFEEELTQLNNALKLLRKDSKSKAVFLIDKNGQQISAEGETEDIDTTSLASLTEGNVAASDSLAKLIGEREFFVLFHEGQRDHIHISIVGNCAILMVIFDERSSLGLVRSCVKRTGTQLGRIFDVIRQKTSGSAFSEITDDDIEALFSN